MGPDRDLNTPWPRHEAAPRHRLGQHRRIFRHARPPKKTNHNAPLDATDLHGSSTPANISILYGLRRVDLVAEPVDVAIRMGELPSNSQPDRAPARPPAALPLRLAALSPIVRRAEPTGRFDPARVPASPRAGQHVDVAPCGRNGRGRGGRPIPAQQYRHDAASRRTGLGHRHASGRNPSWCLLAQDIATSSKGVFPWRTKNRANRRTAPIP